MLSGDSCFSFFYGFIGPPLSFSFVECSSNWHADPFSITFLLWVVRCKNNISIFINDMRFLFTFRYNRSIVSWRNLTSIFVKLRYLRSSSYSSGINRGGGCCRSDCSIFRSSRLVTLFLCGFTIYFLESSILSIMFSWGFHSLYTLGKGA